jgi:serine phosphatase RsbU (regulator of sigma subunit)
VTERKSNDSRFRTISLTCAYLTIALGLMTFVGWISGLPILASIRSSYIPMAPSEALCFSLLGMGLAIQRRLLPRLLAMLVLGLATTKLIEIAGGYHWGIDLWFVRNPQLFGAVPTGRMSPISALTFFLAAQGLIALTDRGWLRIAGPLGTLVGIVGTVVLAGYCYGTPLLYGGRFIPVALSSACAFFLCGLGIIAEAGAESWPRRAFLGHSTQALLLRSFVPIVIAAALINGWIDVKLPHWTHVNPAVISAICAIASAALITWIISQVSQVVGGRIDRAEQARNLAQAELLTLNAELEERVQKRTQQLREKNQQMEEELQMARELQIALLPQQFPTVPPNVSAHESALRFLSWYFPTGNIGGDFFSVFPLGQSSVGVLICDVMGHGVRSALVTSMIRGLVEEHAGVAADPGELLTEINRALSVILKQAGTTMFATCFYLVADVQQAELRFANAGHPAALRLQRGEPIPEKLQADGHGGPAMGIFPGVKYSTSIRNLTEGDLIMLFTDGLFEVEDSSGALFSEERLHLSASRHGTLPPPEFFSALLADVREFSQRETFDDDVCIVGIQVRHMNDRDAQELSTANSREKTQE